MLRSNPYAYPYRLIVCGAKVVAENWYYIIKEVRSVFDAVGDAEVCVVLPETSQISDKLKATFNANIAEMVKDRAEKRVATLKKQEAALVTDAPLYADQSIGNFGDDGHIADVGSKSPNRLGAFDFGRTLLSQSTTEVSATLIMVDSEEPPKEILDAVNNTADLRIPPKKKKDGKKSLKKGTGKKKSTKKKAARKIQTEREFDIYSVYDPYKRDPSYSRSTSKVAH